MEFDNKKPVPEKSLKRVLEAGRWAPSSHNSQPWSFVVVRDGETIEELMKLCYYGFFHSKPRVIIAVILEPNPFGGLGKGGAKKLTDYHGLLNASLPTLNMQYQAQEEGIGSCILSLQEKQANEILGVPRGKRALLAVCIGKEKENAFKVKPSRKPLEELVSWEKYGKK
jgi:nitroreductase